MGKYSRSVQHKPVEKDQTKSLAWRGVGCLLMILVPALSIAAAVATVNSSAVAYIPYEMLGYPVLPDWMFATDGLAFIFTPIANTQDLYAIIVLSAVYMIVFGGGISLLYAIVYRILNPNLYGPMDVPPPKTRAKKYQR